MSHRSQLKLGLLSATIFTGAALAMPALAQEAPAAAVAEEGNAIIVTGTRRTTTVMSTPINISAIGGETLQEQRINDIRALGDFTPGLTVLDTGPGGTGTIVMRGINADDVSDSGANIDTAVGMYLGDVPLYLDFKLIDLQRTEVLFGPQGTLYGLGTLAGSIRYIPNRPDPDKITGYAHARAYDIAHGKDIGWNVDGAINVPIIPGKLAWRSTFGYYDEAGFIDYNYLLRTPGISIAQPGGGSSLPGTSLPDPADPPSLGTAAQRDANLFGKKDQNFEHTISTRQQIGLFPTEGITGYLTYVFQQTKTNGRQSNSAGVLGTGKYENASRYIEPSNRKAHLFSFELEAELGDFAQLVSATAYTKRTVKDQGDVTDLLLDLDYDYELFPAFSGFSKSTNTSKQFNQELRLVSTHEGPFSWVLGGFYNERKTQNDYAERTPGLAQDFGITDNPESLEYVSYSTSKITEKAVFGEATFEITPKWQVTAGGRYFKYDANLLGGIVLPLLGDPLSPYDEEPSGGKAGSDGVVWKFNTSYTFSENLMMYGTYSKGYRIGGPNGVAPCPEDLSAVQNACALPNELFFGPDKTINKELGVRGSLLNRKLNFSLSAYHIDWKGIQLGSVTQFGIVGITVNGGKAVSKGIDFAFDAHPTPQLTISGTYAYNDAHLTQDVPGLLSARNSAFPGFDVNGDSCGAFWVFDASNPQYATCAPKFIDVDGKKGDRLPGSTKNSGTLGVTWDQPLGDASLIANWTAVYRGGVLSRPGARAFGERIPSYVVHRASVTYRKEAWEVRLFADNIFDKYATSSIGLDRSKQTVNDGIANRYYSRGVIAPRKLGVETVFRF